ncbi:MAG: poly-gamma-glutamate synthase PgsB [Candidatus Aminicenantes bacterium]|nr:poly-gamma-glutamate synthase PgsB [Candidatus Aminicenantes bacterium]
MLLAQRIKKIPLRICVTGTRGKSSVVRLIASSLREAGVRVLAKTTGTLPVLIFPDGQEKEIERRGNPSLLEGKKVLKIAAMHQVKALVTELMSIQPEYGFAESIQMIKPGILVITNVGLDHLAQMGSTKMEIARSLAVAIPPRGAVIIPQEELHPLFLDAAERMKSKIIPVTKDTYQELLKSLKKTLPYEFEENLRLALAVSDFMSLKKESALEGISQAQPDFGRLKIWKVKAGVPPRDFHLVSAFAANDPLSTQKAMSKIEEKIPLERKRMIGLLNLRPDRGDRTLQWAEALKNRYFQLFDRWVFIGGHALVLKKRLRSLREARISVMKEKSPPAIMAKLAAMEEGEIVLVGLGNMAGAGRELVKYWERIGKPYDL